MMMIPYLLKGPLLEGPPQRCGPLGNSPVEKGYNRRLSLSSGLARGALPGL
jgi:hypothetical protein